MSFIRIFFPSYFIQAYLQSFRGVPSVAWQGIFVNLVQSIFVGIIYFLTLYFVNYLHFTVFQSGLIISCYGAGTIIGALLGGKLSDRFPPRIISGIALFVESICYLALIKNQHLYFLMLNLFIIGISAYSFTTANTLWVLSKCQRDENLRLQALNILNVASNLGLGLSAIIISFIVFNNFIYLFILASSILFSMTIYIFNIEKNNPLQNMTENKKLLFAPSDFFQDKVLIYVFLSLFAMGIIIAQTNSTYAIFLTKIFPEMGIKSFSILFIINTIMVVLFQTVLVEALSKINKMFLLGASVFLLGASMLILQYSFCFFIAIFSVVVMTIGEILFFSISQFICYEKSAKDKKGQNLGIYRMTYALSRVAGPFLGGFIFQQYGSAQLWYFCFGLGVVFAIPAVFYYKRSFFIIRNVFN